VWGSGVEEGVPQGLKPHRLRLLERPKAKALGYLEAAMCCDATIWAGRGKIERCAGLAMECGLREDVVHLETRRTNTGVLHCVQDDD
jgi:hypothetical protein